MRCTAQQEPSRRMLSKLRKELPFSLWVMGRLMQQKVTVNGLNCVPPKKDILEPLSPGLRM